MRTLAIIPARGGSKRVPGKNSREFAGVPLISWSIRFARAMQSFDTVIVSTDDDNIARIAADEGLPVPFMRPKNLSDDVSSSVDVVKHVIEQELAKGRHYDLIALLQPTSPVRQMDRWHEAFQLLADPAVNAVVGVRPAHDHPYHAYAIDVRKGLDPFVRGGDEVRRLRTQDLPPAYSIAGNLYLIRSAVLNERGSFFPDKSCGVICDGPCETLDIDTELDWIVAETLVRHFGQKPWQHSL